MNGARQLLTQLTADGRLMVWIEPMPMPTPSADEVVVEMKAVPINPSDLRMLVAAGDLDTVRCERVDGHPALVAQVSESTLRRLATRVGRRLGAGNEGAGVVVAAGSSESARALMGRTVTLAGGEMYRTHRVIAANHAVPLPHGASPVEGASMFVNPMTAQAFLDTMQEEGHSALVHTAAASNLGQMLARLCRRRSVPLVAIVRTDSQRAILAEIGAEYVVDSSQDGFVSALTDAIGATGATLAFDALGGGQMAEDILTAMERALVRRETDYLIYGASTHKQVYVYGRLEPAPLQLSGAYGMYWSVGAWLLTPRLAAAGPERTRAMRQYAIEERNGIFASRYGRTIRFDDMISSDIARAYAQTATGQKYLVDPSR